MLIAFSAVAAIALAACSSAAPAWPNAGQARETLTSKYNYHFTPYNDTYRAANSGLTLQISTPKNPAATDQMSISVFYAPFTSFETDFDNVFSVIAPDAKPWEQDVFKRVQTVATLNDQYQASGGLVTVVWEQSVPLLTFVFTGGSGPAAS